MGRRKWKHYQDQETRNQLNIAEQLPISITQETEDCPSDNNNHYKTLNHRLEQPNGNNSSSSNCNSDSSNNKGLLQFERDFGKLKL